MTWFSKALLTMAWFFCICSLFGRENRHVPEIDVLPRPEYPYDIHITMRKIHLDSFSSTIIINGNQPDDSINFIVIIAKERGLFLGPLKGKITYLRNGKGNSSFSGKDGNGKVITKTVSFRERLVDIRFSSKVKGSLKLVKKLEDVFKKKGVLGLNFIDIDQEREGVKNIISKIGENKGTKRRLSKMISDGLALLSSFKLKVVSHQDLKKTADWLREYGYIREGETGYELYTLVKHYYNTYRRPKSEPVPEKVPDI